MMKGLYGVLLVLMVVGTVNTALCWSCIASENVSANDYARMAQEVVDCR